MTTPASKFSALIHHTFGREHHKPPPLPTHMQMEMSASNGEERSSNVPPKDGVLPHDFDHLVRSVGEW